MFKKFQTGYQIAKTIASPITHARNIIKSKFSKTGPTIKSVKPKATSDASKRFKSKIEQTKKAIKKGTDEFKKENPDRAISDKQIKAVERKQTEKSNKKTRKEFLREPKKTGGRIGYKGGKLVGNQKKIDVAPPFGTINKKDFKVLQAKNKNKKKVI